MFEPEYRFLQSTAYNILVPAGTIHLPACWFVCLPGCTIAFHLPILTWGTYLCQTDIHKDASLGKGRTRAAIGTHDLAHVVVRPRKRKDVKGDENQMSTKAETDFGDSNADIAWEALPPGKISFVPLNQSRAMDGNEIVSVYGGLVPNSLIKVPLSMRKYAKSLTSLEKYAVLRDRSGKVLSLPPLINSSATAVSHDTTDIVIECSADNLNITNSKGGKPHVCCPCLLSSLHDQWL